MQITLKQQHVEAAIKAYVAKAGIQFPVENIDFTNGRGKDGLTATIEMEDPFLADVPEPVSKPKPATTRTMEARGSENSMPTESKKEPAPEPEQVETPDPEPEAKEDQKEEPAFVPDETEEAFEAPEPETKAPEKKKASSLFS